MEDLLDSRNTELLTGSPTAPSKGWRLVLGAATVGAVVGAGVGAWAVPKVAAGDDPDAGSPTTANLLRRLEVHRLQADVDADVATEDAMLADDFRLMPPDGSVRTKADFMGALASGTIDFTDISVPGDIVVRVYGDGAVLTHWSDIRLTVRDMEQLHHGAWNTVVYEKVAGDWQVRSVQTTGDGFLPPSR